MKNEIKRRKVPEGSCLHIYKRTVDGGVLFYRVIDHLVYYTIESVMAHRHNLSVLVTCHMFTHTHDLVVATDLSQLTAFEHDLNCVFTREYNDETGREGRLFEGPFGRAPKRSDKDKRSAAIYIMNNPVLSQCRWALRDAMKEVDIEYHCGRYLGYAILHRLFDALSDEERWQLTDYIIHRYFFFDVKGCCKLFGSVERMVKTADETKGKEFDVGEEFDPSSDVSYREMCAIAGRAGLLKKGFPLFHLSEARAMNMSNTLQQKTGATDLQIKRFIHL